MNCPHCISIGYLNKRTFTRQGKSSAAKQNPERQITEGSLHALLALYKYTQTNTIVFATEASIRAVRPPLMLDFALQCREQPGQLTQIFCKRLQILTQEYNRARRSIAYSPDSTRSSSAKTPRVHSSVRTGVLHSATVKMFIQRV